MSLLGYCDKMSSVEELIRDNPLFKAYSEKAKLWQILGYPPILSQIFGNQWLDDLKKKLDYGPFYPKFLAFLAGDVEPLVNLEGFNAIKQKLSEVNEDFFPTLFEIVIASLFKRNNFPIELEDTFHVYNRRSEKVHPDLRVKMKGNWIYYEMTDVLDYSDRKHFQDIYNNLSSFWEAIFMLKKDLSLTIRFRNMPSLNEIKEITDYIAGEFVNNQFPINLEKDNVSLNVTDGNACKILLPVNIIERKLRDKYDQELGQFDPKEINVVAIDTTALIGEFDTFSKIIKQIFEENQIDIVNGVVLVSKRYVVREGRIGLEKGFCIVENKYAKKFDFFPLERLKYFNAGGRKSCGKC